MHGKRCDNLPARSQSLIQPTDCSWVLLASPSVHAGYPRVSAHQCRDKHSAGCCWCDCASATQDLWTSKSIPFIGKNKADWAKNLQMDDFELLCTDGRRANVMDYRECNLAEVPTHAVVVRPEKANKIRDLLERQEVGGPDSGRNVLGRFLHRVLIFSEQWCSAFHQVSKMWKVLTYWYGVRASSLKLPLPPSLPSCSYRQVERLPMTVSSSWWRTATERLVQAESCFLSTFYIHLPLCDFISETVWSKWKREKQVHDVWVSKQRSSV